MRRPWENLQVALALVDAIVAISEAAFLADEFQTEPPPVIDQTWRQAAQNVCNGVEVSEFEYDRLVEQAEAILLELEPHWATAVHGFAWSLPEVFKHWQVRLPREDE